MPRSSVRILNLRKVRALFVTVVLVVIANIAISYAQKSTVSHGQITHNRSVGSLPNPPRP